MRAVVQRVTSGEVSVEGRTVGRVGRGLVIFLGIAHDDGPDDLSYLAKKVSSLRIFEDNEGKMNLSVKEAGGELLCVSQFTLYGDCRKGNRPSFTGAARPENAESIYLEFCDYLRGKGLTVKTGKFGAMMKVEVANNGPVTILLDSKKLF